MEIRKVRKGGNVIEVLSSGRLLFSPSVYPMTLCYLWCASQKVLYCCRMMGKYFCGWAKMNRFPRPYHTRILYCFGFQLHLVRKWEILLKLKWFLVWICSYRDFNFLRCYFFFLLFFDHQRETSKTSTHCNYGIFGVKTLFHWTAFAINPNVMLYTKSWFWSFYVSNIYVSFTICMPISMS